MEGEVGVVGVDVEPGRLTVGETEDPVGRGPVPSPGRGGRGGGGFVPPPPLSPFGSSFFFIGFSGFVPDLTVFSAVTTAAKRVTSFHTPGLFVTDSNTFRY